MLFAFLFIYLFHIFTALYSSPDLNMTTYFKS